MSQTQEALSQEAWIKAEAKPISVQQLDELVVDYKRKRTEYETAKSKATDLQKIQAQAEGALLEALRSSGKKKYHVDGLGTASVVEKLVYRVPGTLADKTEFFSWLEKRYGHTFLLDKQSVNSQSLQKICNDAFTEEIEAGRGAEFRIPGLVDPTPNYSLSFRKG